jgi:arginine decarboxylase
LNQKYILLPVNNWDSEYERVNLGGITCDGQDYYNQEAHMNSVFMPKTRKVQYLGFFNTGAYQEVLSGYGGIHHCLLPSPKHVIIRRNRDETFNFEVFGEEQNSKQVLKILGYTLSCEWWVISCEIYNDFKIIKSLLRFAGGFFVLHSFGNDCVNIYP